MGGNVYQLLPEERHVGLSDIHTVEHADRRLSLTTATEEKRESQYFKLLFT